jgi:hypothetical protein
VRVVKWGQEPGKHPGGDRPHGFVACENPSRCEDAHVNDARYHLGAKGRARLGEVVIDVLALDSDAGESRANEVDLFSCRRGSEKHTGEIEQGAGLLGLLAHQERSSDLLLGKERHVRICADGVSQVSEPGEEWVGEVALGERPQVWQVTVGLALMAAPNDEGDLEIAQPAFCLLTVGLTCPIDQAHGTCQRQIARRAGEASAQFFRKPLRLSWAEARAPKGVAFRSQPVGSRHHGFMAASDLCISPAFTELTYTEVPPTPRRTRWVGRCPRRSSPRDH